MTRLTNKWTKTTTEAFGNTIPVRKGYLAERMYYKYAMPIYDSVDYCPDNRVNQMAGVDIVLYKDTWSRPYTVDVKGNMTNSGTFFVDLTHDGWLFNPRKTNDRVCHICVDTGWAIEYDVREMRQFCKPLTSRQKSVQFNSIRSKFPFRVRKFKMETISE